MKYSKLADIRNLFLVNNSAASNGKAIIDRYNSEKQSNLKKLLRHHSEEEIYENETYKRDNVDYFLEYFSVIALGHITGYITLEELQEDRQEIIYYLNLSPLKKYYYEYYPLILPQILLETLMHNRSFRKFAKTPASDQKEITFHQFHVLNQTIDNDDVNQLLWFLDNGESYNYNLYDLKKALNNTKKCFKQRSREHALGQSIRGFFFYLDFLQQFDLFLKRKVTGLDRSAYWIYHSYWFSRVNKELRSSIHKFFNGLEIYISSVEDVRMHQSVARVNASRKLYIDILERVVYNTKYHDSFLIYLNKWRKTDMSDSIS